MNGGYAGGQREEKMHSKAQQRVQRWAEGRGAKGRRKSREEAGGLRWEKGIP